LPPNTRTLKGQSYSTKRWANLAWPKGSKLSGFSTQIQDVYAAFSTDAVLQIEKNNKAAGTRARKASLELEKLMKEFRKLSLEESKK
jgi:hypothetical protein